MAVMPFEHRTDQLGTSKAWFTQATRDVLEVGTPVAQHYGYRMASILLKSYLVSLYGLYDLAASGMVFTVGRLIKYALSALVAQSAVFVANLYGDYLKLSDARAPIKKAIHRTIHSAWLLGAGLSVLGLMVCWLAPALLASFVSNPLILQQASSYLFVYGASLPLRIWNDINFGVLSSLGEHRLYRRLAFLHFVADIVFAMVLIPLMGLPGAAYAVLASAILTSGYTLFSMHGCQSDLLKGLFSLSAFSPDISTMKRFLRLGLPSSLSSLTYYGVMFCSALIANLYGLQVMIEFVVIKDVLNFLYNLACGYAWAGKVLVARNLPSQVDLLNDTRGVQAIKQYGWITTVHLTLGFLVAAIVSMLLTPALLHYLLPASASFDWMNLAILCLSFVLAKSALLWQNSATLLLEGLKDTLFSSVNNVAVMLVITIPLQYACYAYGLGFFSLGLAMAAGAATSALFNTTYFFRRTETMMHQKAAETVEAPYAYDPDQVSSNAVLSRLGRSA